METAEKTASEVLLSIFRARAIMGYGLYMVVRNTMGETVPAWTNLSAEEQAEWMWHGIRADDPAPIRARSRRVQVNPRHRRR